MKKLSEEEKIPRHCEYCGNPESVCNYHKGCQGKKTQVLEAENAELKKLVQMKDGIVEKMDCHCDIFVHDGLYGEAVKITRTDSKCDRCLILSLTPESIREKGEAEKKVIAGSLRVERHVRALRGIPKADKHCNEDCDVFLEALTHYKKLKG